MRDLTEQLAPKKSKTLRLRKVCLGERGLTMLQKNEPHYEYIDGELVGVYFSDRDINGLMRHMIETSGKTAAQISRELGRTGNYLSVVLSEGRTPRTDLFIDIAVACGYRIGMDRTDRKESILIQRNDGLYLDGGTLKAIETTPQDWSATAYPDTIDPFTA